MQLFKKNMATLSYGYNLQEYFFFSFHFQSRVHKSKVSLLHMVDVELYLLKVLSLKPLCFFWLIRFIYRLLKRLLIAKDYCHFANCFLSRSSFAPPFRSHCLLLCFVEFHSDIHRFLFYFLFVSSRAFSLWLPCGLHTKSYNNPLHVDSSLTSTADEFSTHSPFFSTHTLYYWCHKLHVFMLCIH